MSPAHAGYGWLVSDLSGWEIGAVIATAVTAIGGFVLGLRAELRSSRYVSRFDIDDGLNRVPRYLTVVNRTGETANDVILVHTPSRTPLMAMSIGGVARVLADGEKIDALVEWDSIADGPTVISVEWDRPSTGVHYRQIDSRPDKRSFRERLGDGIRGSEPGFRRQRPLGRKVRR